MDKLELTIAKWKTFQKAGDDARQSSIMNGASKKDISAMDAYLATIKRILDDLENLREDDSK